MTEQVHFRDFTKKRSPVYFTIGEQRFDCVKSLSPKKIQTLLTTIRGNQTVDESNVLDRLEQVLHLVMIGDSFTRFQALLNADDDDNDADPDEASLDLEQLVDIFHWIVEVYTGRPLTGSPDSSTSSQSDESGTSSTAGAPLAESIL